MFRRRRIALLAFAALVLPALALALAGCGLEPLPIGLLPDPVEDSDPASQIFQFKPPDLSLLTPEQMLALDEVWVGFEIYYKLFPESVSAPSSYNSVEDMLLDSYHRFNNSGTGTNNLRTDSPGSVSLPLIPASVFALGASVSKVKVDFSNMSDASEDYPKITVLNAVDTMTSEITRARRSVASATEFKRFTEFEALDISALNSDLTTEVYLEISSPFPPAIGVVCFAASWGFDLNSGRIVYSNPVWLGQEAIVFPYP